MQYYYLIYLEIYKLYVTWLCSTNINNMKTLTKFILLISVIFPLKVIAQNSPYMGFASNYAFIAGVGVVDNNVYYIPYKTVATSISGNHASIDSTMINPNNISVLLSDLQNAISGFTNEANQSNLAISNSSRI